MKASQLFFKTYKDAPSDAEIISHKLFERAGYIKRLHRGVYTYTPIMWRVLQKLKNLIRKELNKAGCQEIFMPQLQPAKIWEASGRWEAYTAENLLYTLEDREGARCCLGPTHEEAITHLVTHWLTSYKQLPVNLYQINNKFRDEIRPRFGLMRSKEFLMKDAYSFCTDKVQMNEQYESVRKAYIAIFDQLKLDYAIVEADGGTIGEGRTEEFQVLADNGEDLVLVAGDHAANVETLQARPKAFSYTDNGLEMEKVSTPEAHTIELLTKQLSIQAEEILKTLIFKYNSGEMDEFVAVCIRGDREVNEVKLKNHLEAIEVGLASDEEVERITGTKMGYVGPLNLPLKVLYDLSVKEMTSFVCGANEPGFHYQNIKWERDLQVQAPMDLMLAREGDFHMEDPSRTYIARRGIEAGQIFNLGTKYSDSMGAHYQDETGQMKPLYMGCYGIGVGRLSAAVIEQSHDDKGMIWPLVIAPFHVAITAAKPNDEEMSKVANELYEGLLQLGFDVLLDDRDERMGFKFKDQDLIGIPYKIIIGKSYKASGEVEAESRIGEKSSFNPKELKAWASTHLS